MLHSCEFRIFTTLVFLIIHFVNSENLSKDSSKFTDDELRMCVNSFAVHTDKIIRTQDSLELGAKYIMDTEVDGRQDCLKLCCRNSDCDVFIFEEKKQGGCFLFHCGPPHDFKCKFTSHVNYTSAVLTNLNYHNPLPHDDRIRQSQQEHELKSLRKKKERPLIKYIYTETSAPIITEVPKLPPSTPPPPPPPPPPPKNICNRNQYECKTSHDCIAIYNVCDGIPQCSDGSDEAPDLRCEPEKPTPPPSVLQEPILSNPDLAKYSMIPQHHRSYNPYYGNQKIGQKTWQPMRENAPQQGDIQYPQQPLPPGNYVPQDYANNWEYRQMYDQNKAESYPQMNVFHGKDNLMHYDHEKSHIFNKNRPGILMENSDVGAANGGNYAEPERPYEPPYYPRQHNHNWQENPLIGGEVPPQQQPQLPISSGNEGKEINEHTHDVKKIGHVMTENKVLPEEPATPKSNLSIKKELQTQVNVHPPKQQSEVSTPSKNPSSSSSDDTKFNTTNNSNQSVENHSNKDKSNNNDNKKPAEKHEEVRIHYYVAEHLQQNNHKDINAILKPRGAVISLAIGISVTVIMVALITCRLRVVRKRGRRHGPFAHDADYLMNGMYL